MKHAVQSLLAALCLLLSLSTAFADIPNGGFESGINDWEWTCPIEVGTDYNLGIGCTSDARYEGDASLLAYARLSGVAGDHVLGQAWSLPVDITHAANLSFYARDFFSAVGGSAAVEDISLVLGDGSTVARAKLFDGRTKSVCLPFTSSLGADGFLWDRFVVPLDSAAFGAGFLSLNQAATRVGVEMELEILEGARTAEVSAFVDNVALEPVPEPSALLGLACGLAGVGAISLRRRR